MQARLLMPTISRVTIDDQIITLDATLFPYRMRQPLH